MHVQTTQDLEADRRRLQETLRREVEARKRVDQMLRGYKDEVTIFLRTVCTIAGLQPTTYFV